MFGFFKRKKKEASEPKKAPKMLDMNGEPLAEGDLVEAFRYELGKCRLVMKEGHLHYESLDSGKQVIWARMIDAATDLQKVKKIPS